MKRIHYARKKRQLKALAKKLELLLNDNTNHAAEEVNKLVIKIRLILKDLFGVITRFDAKKVLGAAAISLGLFYSGEVNAQVFDPAVQNPFGIDTTQTFAMPAFADLDGDGDMDLLVGQYMGDMMYYENTGTASAPAFAASVMNPFGITGTGTLAWPTFADLDDDGDMDLLAGDYYGGFNYYENTGSASSPAFGAPSNNPFGLASVYYFAAPSFADLDGDGDLDLISGNYGGSLQYFENTGSATSPAFAAAVDSPFGLTTPNYLSAPVMTDLDNDGDFDLLVGGYGGDLLFFENTGSATAPAFGSSQTNPFGLTAGYYYSWPATADLDGDGDQDVLVGEVYGNMQYFKNNLITGVNEVAEATSLKMYPNPVENTLWIDTDQKIERVEVYNIVGQQMIVVKNVTNQINVENLKQGMYTVKVIFKSGEQTISKLQKM